jgi:N-acetylneuraminic acid mutarotase
VNTQFFDIWIYDVQRNEWNAIEPDSRPPSQLRDTFEPVAIFVPKATGFDIFVYGGVNYRTNSAMRILYRFDSVINNWIIESTLGPVAYQGGSGVYHSETNSLRFITGYTLPRNYFTYEYSINSGTWNVLARRASNTLLYQTPVIYTNPEIALVHGGYSPDSVTSCFQSVVEVLDVACNNWTNLVTFPVLPRKGHGLIYRGESLWIFGGSDGILHNDVVEIPISLPITSNSTRNQCRGKSN